jgi:hypothetical protein
MRHHFSKTKVRVTAMFDQHEKAYDRVHVELDCFEKAQTHSQL